MGKIIHKYSHLDEMKAEEIRDWQKLSPEERMNAVAEMTLAHPETMKMLEVTPPPNSPPPLPSPLGKGKRGKGEGSFSEQSVLPLAAPRNHEMSFRAKRGILLCVGKTAPERPGRDSSLRSE